MHYFQQMSEWWGVFNLGECWHLFRMLPGVAEGPMEESCCRELHLTPAQTWVSLRAGVRAGGLVLQPGFKLALVASALSVISGLSVVMGSDAHCSLAGYAFWMCLLEKWKHLLDFHPKQMGWCSIGTWRMDKVSAVWPGMKTISHRGFWSVYPEHLRALLVLWLWVTVLRSFWDCIF